MFIFLSIMHYHEGSVWSVLNIFCSITMTQQTAAESKTYFWFTKRTRSLATDGLAPSEPWSQYHGVRLGLPVETEAAEIPTFTVQKNCGDFSKIQEQQSCIWLISYTLGGRGQLGFEPRTLQQIHCDLLPNFLLLNYFKKMCIIEVITAWIKSTDNS